MGKNDNRASLKMRRKKSQAKFKARNQRKKAARVPAPVAKKAPGRKTAAAAPAAS